MGPFWFAFEGEQKQLVAILGMGPNPTFRTSPPPPRKKIKQQQQQQQTKTEKKHLCQFDAWLQNKSATGSKAHTPMVCVTLDPRRVHRRALCADGELNGRTPCMQGKGMTKPNGEIGFLQFSPNCNPRIAPLNKMYPMT